MPAPKRYFAIAFTHDKDHDGNLPPAAALSINVLRPRMQQDGSVEIAPESASVQPIPGTRIFETDDPVIAEALSQCPESLLIEIEQPSAKAIKEQKDQTATHLAAIAAASKSDGPADPDPEA